LGSGEVHLKTYVAALTAFACLLCASWTYWYELTLDPRLIAGTIIFACLILLGDIFSIRVSERITIGVWSVALMIAVVMMGPTWAALAAIPSALYVGKRDLLRTIYELGHSVTIVYLAGIAFFFASEPLLISDPESLVTVFYGTLVAGVTLLGTSEASNSILLRVKYDQPFHESWREMTQPYLLSSAVNVLTAGLGMLTLEAYGPVTAVVVIAGSIGSQALVYYSREQKRDNDDLRSRVGSLEKALATSNMSFGTMMIRDLGRRDGYTHRHAAATAVYAADLAREMKLDETRAERLRMAGLLHNIGLFGLPEDLLTAGKPNSIAQSRLAEHPARGEEALAAIPEFEEMASWVRWHHERPDGRGYPDKLRAPWIPLEAKILAVAQAYAAMVLDQPSRPGMSFADAREKLSAGIDTEFDGIVVRALLRILETESEGYRMADDHRFVFPAPDHRRRPRPDVAEAAEGGARGLPR
jgi:HD-GYP domain-containing protein (c-di-GMP phosphodiesterase class II)/predicted membrane protein